MDTNKEIKYINRDFDSLKKGLVDFSKTYFPSTYNDFSPNSPGAMFIEMASYVGDVLSFYIDNQVQETFLQYARQESNLYDLAYMMGYSPKVTGTSLTEVEVYHQVPAVINGSGEYVPDFNYALKISENSILGSTDNTSISFFIEDPVDFTVSSSSDPTEISVYSTAGVLPQYFLLKKKRKAISGTVRTAQVSFDTPSRYPVYSLTDTNIVKILDITDSDGNIYTEVPYLAQETVFEKIKNPSEYGIDPNAQADSSDVPYLLRLKKVPRRFVTRFKSKTQLDIQFGAGTDDANVDEELTPNPDNVGIGLPYTINKTTTAFDPENFLHTKTYGIAPTNTTLTIRYIVGGGVTSNIPGNTLNTISSAEILFQKDDLNATQAQTVFDSLLINNPQPAVGGNDGDSLQEIRNNSLGNFGAQLRSVTQEDYLVRALSLPSEYGSISKAYIEPQKIESLSLGEIPNVLDLYVLSFNNLKQLVTASTTLKNNLRTYLSEYRTINDSVRIKDAFIVNIGIDFDLIILPNYNSREVISNCINELQSYFNIDNQQINQPILLKELFILLDKVKGVQTVNDIIITNLTGGSYSQYSYDIKGATLNNIIYPSLDPCIFEVKFPNTDIKGRVRTL